MNDFVSIVLKESFSDPLIDVLLSMPPASNINKTSELELIEILARHSYQRKGNVIVIALANASKNAIDRHQILFLMLNEFMRIY